MKKLLIIPLVFIALAVCGLVVFSLRDTEMIEQGMKKVLPPKIQKAPAPALRPPARKLTPQRPEDYGMVVTGQAPVPADQGHYDALIKGKIRELKNRYPPEDWEKVREKIKEEPAVTAEKLARIDKGIKECRQLLEKEPDNLEVKQKLERLMMLKSIGEELP